jgi:hypothetical protein
MEKETLIAQEQVYFIYDDDDAVCLFLAVAAAATAVICCFVRPFHVQCQVNTERVILL